MVPGVTVTVRAAVPTYLRTDVAVVHVFVVLSVVESTLRTFLFGAVTSMEDPSWSAKLKVDAFTVIDSTTAVAPETFTTMPPILSTTVVSILTSVAAARVRDGATSNATTIPARASIRGIVSSVS